MFVKQHFFPNILNSKWLVWKPTNFIYQLRFKWNWLDSLNQQTWMLPNVDTLWLVDPVVNIQKIRCCGACTSGALNVRSRERWSIESKYTSFGRFWVEDNDDMQVVILIWCSCDVAVAIYVKHAFRYVVVTSTSPANWGCHICISWVGEIMYGIIHTDKCIYIYIWVFEFLRPTSSVLFRPKVQATPSCSFLRVWLYIYIYIYHKTFQDSIGWKGQFHELLLYKQTIQKDKGMAPMKSQQRGICLWKKDSRAYEGRLIYYCV